MAREYTVKVRLNSAEHETLQRLIEATGGTTSTVLRDLLRTATVKTVTITRDAPVAKPLENRVVYENMEEGEVEA